MNSLKKNTRWFSLIFLLIFFGTIGLIMAGQAVIDFTKQNKTPWYNNQILETKPFRMQM